MSKSNKKGLCEFISLTKEDSYFVVVLRPVLGLTRIFKSDRVTVERDRVVAFNGANLLQSLRKSCRRGMRFAG